MAAVFAAKTPAELPDDLPLAVHKVVDAATDLFQRITRDFMWGNLPLFAAKIISPFMQPLLTFHITQLNPEGVQSAARMLRRLVATAPELDQAPGDQHLGALVITEGVMVLDGTGLPDLPDEQLREWYQDAVASGTIRQVQAAGGVMNDGWRFQVTTTRGTGGLDIAACAPDEEWREALACVADAEMVNNYFRQQAGP